MKQLRILSVRYIELIKNDRARVLTLLLQPVIIGFLLSLVAGSDAFKTFEETKSILFALSCAGIWMGLFDSIQEICKERSILKREYAANLSMPAYVLSKFIVQCLISIVQAFLLLAIFSIFTGNPSKGLLFGISFFEMWFSVFLTIFSSAAIGLVFSSISKNSDRAMTMAPFILIIQLLFSGMLFNLSGFTKYLSYITISRWSVGVLGSIADVNSLPTKIPDAPKITQTIYDATILHEFGLWGILLLFIIISFVICAILLRNVSKDSR